MAKFMCNATYTAGGQGACEGRRNQTQRGCQQGARGARRHSECFYFTLGAQDAVLILDVPDTVTGVALSLAVNASGAVRLSLTQLVTPAEMDAAAKKTIPYTAPGA